MYQRQTMIFGTIGAIMTLAALISLLWLTDVLPSPFDDKFSAAPPREKAFIPCVDETQESLAFNALNVRVYNSTTRSGLANILSKSLTDQGITVEKVGNWQANVKESVRIVTGPSGLRAAYSLVPVFPGSTVILEGDRTSQTIDLIIGEAYDQAPGETTLKEAAPGGMPLKSLENCQPISGDINELSSNTDSGETTDDEKPEGDQ